jgi:alpha-beta hydrolase superfamily lysophospholipase
MPSTVKTIKIYDGARHELLNETNKQEVIADLQTWIDSTLAAQPEVSQ